MISNLSLQFGKRILFDNVNIKFTKGNCYGIIGANGSGKSTFLKIISGEQDFTTGKISIEPGKRISVLRQEHNIFDKHTVLESVIMGNKNLYLIKQQMDFLYTKLKFSEKDAIRVGELGTMYEEMGGWNAETDASILLSNLNILEKYHNKLMNSIDNKTKVRILLAQAIFDNPDILILDEPTNNLNVETISWLENFLADYKNTVIVVSHDRHFLDIVCTHICDLDFGKLNVFTGNYSFWYETNQLISKQKNQQNKKSEEKRKEIQEFIQRFSSNVSKAKQATARKKMLEKLNIEDIKPSSRRYPGIIFEQAREAGDQILEIKNLAKYLNNKILFKNLSINLKRKDKVAIISQDSKTISMFYEILMNIVSPDLGTFTWGSTIKHAYLPDNNTSYFNNDLNLIDWLRQYIDDNEKYYEEYIRGFLGKMLFSGDEVFKKTSVLSGGEKMRCMFARMMLYKANVILLNEPTNHLDLESITALNNALNTFKGTILITSQDHELIQTVCNRIVELTPNGVIDKYITYDEYLIDSKIKKLREKYYSNEVY